MKRKTGKIIAIVLSAALISSCAVFAACKKPDESTVTVAEHKIVGSGGYGAVFCTKIDPFEETYLTGLCDMGCWYFSYDAGASWQRHNIKGTLYDVQYDETKEGVVWAAGSGVFKSSDHGRSVEMVFPKESEITSSGNNYENINNWLYTDKASDYLPQYQIQSIAINRKNSDEVYVGQRVPGSGFGAEKGIYIYRTQNGRDFTMFARLAYSFNFKLDFDESRNCLVVVTPEKITEVDASGAIAWEKEASVFVHHTNGNVLAFESSYDKAHDKNTFVYSSPRAVGSGNGSEYDRHVGTACYKTNDLRDESGYVDLMETLCSETVYELGVEAGEERYEGLKSYQYYEWIEGRGFVLHEFPITIVNVHVLSDDVVYLNNEVVIDKVNGSTRRVIGYLKYDEKNQDPHRFKWVFGMPHRPVETIVNRSWQDGDSANCFGMCSSPQNENALVFCSMAGVYYTPDGERVYQCNSNVLERDITLTAKRADGVTAEITGAMRTVTTGADVYCTHRVDIDPFDKNHILMACTDFGMLQSFDGGESWIRMLREWSGDSVGYMGLTYRNTCYDVHFDRKNKDIVYSLWSRIQTAPYAASTKYIENDCRFGISYDGGISWTISNITPDGKGIAYRMQVVYSGENRTIYVATDSDGFFISRDCGKTFLPMNAGIQPSKLLGENRSDIFANEILYCKAGLFAITGATADYAADQKFYKWSTEKNVWEEIPLPVSVVEGTEYKPAAIRDIVYDEKNDCMYLAATANVITNYSSIKKAAGGVWKYKNGEFSQMFDETQSVFGVNLDSTGRLYATVLDGAIIRYYDNNTKYYTLIDGLFHRPKNISFGATDNVLYVTTWGGGTERLTLR